jgi:hypothetical protein
LVIAFALGVPGGYETQCSEAMPISLQLLKLFFSISFAIASLGATLGIVRFLGILGAFEIIKKELRQFSPTSLKIVKTSFYSAKHWLTMFREMWSLNSIIA